MKAQTSFVVRFASGRGCEGHENIYPDTHIIKAASLDDAVKQLREMDGFYITKETRASYTGEPVFVPYHNVLSITEHGK